MELTLPWMLVCLLVALLPLAGSAGFAAGKDVGREQERRRLSGRRKHGLDVVRPDTRTEHK